MRILLAATLLALSFPVANAANYLGSYAQFGTLSGYGAIRVSVSYKSRLGSYVISIDQNLGSDVIHSDIKTLNLAGHPAYFYQFLNGRVMVVALNGRWSIRKSKFAIRGIARSLIGSALVDAPYAISLNLGHSGQMRGTVATSVSSMSFQAKR